MPTGGDLPERVEVDEVFYRPYLREKLIAAEEDVEAGRVLSHEEVVAETAKWFLDWRASMIGPE
jgi:predicted transcriptional regulator